MKERKTSIEKEDERKKDIYRKNKKERKKSIEKTR
jgi:hypothetical protein